MYQPWPHGPAAGAEHGQQRAALRRKAQGSCVEVSGVEAPRGLHPLSCGFFSKSGNPPGKCDGKCYGKCQENAGKMPGNGFLPGMVRDIANSLELQEFQAGELLRL